MEVNVIQVGNSKGIRLPKTIIDEYEIGNSIELKLKSDHIEIRPIKKPRENWQIKMTELANDQNEEKLIPGFFEDEEI